MNARRLRLMLGLLRQNIAAYIGAIGSTIMTVSIGFITPLLLAETIDAIIGTHPLHAPAWIVRCFEAIGGRIYVANHLWIVALLLMGLTAVNGIFMFIKGKTSALASENVALSLRERLYNHLQHLTYNYHVKAETGDLIQRCTSDVDTIRRFLSMQLVEVVNAVLMVIIALTIMLGKHVKLALLSILLVPLLFLFAFAFFKLVMKHFRISDEAEGRMSAVLQENLTAVRVVRAFGRQHYEVEKFETVSKDYRDRSRKLCDLLAIYWSASDAISMIQIGITLLSGVFFASKGEISVGTLTIFISYISMLIWPIRQLGRILSDAGKSLVALERIDQILRQPPETDAPDSLTPDIHRDVVFDDVCFGYDDAHPVLQHVSFTVRQGQTVAILGATGSGKSTLVHLLQRLYEPKSGQITIGGVPLPRIRKDWLRAHVGLVLQEPFLYSKTIQENLAIARNQCPEEEVFEAARIAQADDFIRESEKGYDTVVGERGVTLSGGQKQRVAIARTLLKPNDILIFDDSLSAVDTQTDAAIRAALRKRQKDITTFIISHRITTLSEADFILVLERGHIVQQGTHAQLIAQPGLYQRIHHIQNELEEELQDDTQSEVISHAVS